ncbi:MAG: PAS domain S-box protein, partial [Prolixibacteraceae bacterium]|nr:PAS domain S-box protein [Prolixibacteraceae bacterium]
MNKKDETTILLNVLSLEDSSGDFEIISEKLISAGYILNISRVEKESEFISLTKKNRYDIILADYNLPGFNAFEALKICKEQCPEVPVICVSGSIGEITAIELLKQGAVDYVLKDRLERLPFAIKRALAEAKEKTNRQKAEEALRKSEERLRDIIFSTADWVWEIDENAVFTYSSQRGEELFDMPQEEIIGKTPFDFMPKEEARRTKKIFSELLKNKAPVVDLENWNIGKNGQKICLLTNARPIFNNKGELKGYRGVDKNITERKLAEEAIRQSEAELNYAQEIAKMGSWQYHFTTKKFRWSRNMYLLFGYKSFEKEISLDEFKEHVHPEDRYLIDLSIQKTIATRTGLSFDFRYILPDGETIWLQNNMSPTFRNNKLLEIQGVNINITKKKIAEQELIKAKEKAEASDRLKTAFMNNIS